MGGRWVPGIAGVGDKMRRIAAFVAWRHGWTVGAGNRRRGRQDAADRRFCGVAAWVAGGCRESPAWATRCGGSPLLWRGCMGCWWVPGIAGVGDKMRRATGREMVLGVLLCGVQSVGLLRNWPRMEHGSSRIRRPQWSLLQSTAAFLAWWHGAADRRICGVAAWVAGGCGESPRGRQDAANHCVWGGACKHAFGRVESLADSSGCDGQGSPGPAAGAGPLMETEMCLAAVGGVV
jgi:hypothetical protein